jgi:hypothetical protein
MAPITEHTIPDPELPRPLEPIGAQQTRTRVALEFFRERPDVEVLP